MSDQVATAIRPDEDPRSSGGSGASAGRVVVGVDTSRKSVAWHQAVAAMIVLLLVGATSGAAVGQLLAAGLNALLGSLHLGG